MNERLQGGIPLLTVEETVSTNADLLQGRDYQALGACALRARRQTGGRGRHGRRWHSGEDALTFSVRWPFSRPSQGLSGLALAVSLGLANTLEELGCQSIEIKWPNDLYHDGKKLGGILIELGKAGVTTPVIVGVGLNVGPVHRVLDHPSTCLHHFGPPVDAKTLYPQLVAGLIPVLERFDSEGFAPFQAQWHQRALWLNQTVTSGPLEGVFIGVDALGAAIIQTDDGNSHLFSGEVSLRTQGGKA